MIFSKNIKVLTLGIHLWKKKTVTRHSRTFIRPLDAGSSYNTVDLQVKKPWENAYKDLKQARVSDIQIQVKNGTEISKKQASILSTLAI